MKVAKKTPKTPRPVKRPGRHSPLVLMDNGKAVSVLLDIKEYERLLERLEDLEDLAEIERIKRESPDYITLDEYLEQRG